MRNPLNMLKHAKLHLKAERGSGDLQDSIARNRSLVTLDEAIREVILHRFDAEYNDAQYEQKLDANRHAKNMCTYQHEELVARGQVQPIAEEI